MPSKFTAYRPLSNQPVADLLLFRLALRFLQFSCSLFLAKLGV